MIPPPPAVKYKWSLIKSHNFRDRQALQNSNKYLRNKLYFTKEDFWEEIRSVRHSILPIMYPMRRDRNNSYLSVAKRIVNGITYIIAILNDVSDSHALSPTKVATPDISDNIMNVFNPYSVKSSSHSLYS